MEDGGSMYKKLKMILFLSSSYICGYNQDDISTVLHNCQTILEVLSSGDTDKIKELLQDPEMREALVVSIIAARKQ
jgi:hypothetical protein